MKRIHDKTRNYDSETGQRLSNVYKLRHLRVQEAIKKKENVAKFKSFQGRCINSTNKVKGFWELLKGKKCDKTLSQLLNPVNKSEMLTEKNDVNTILSSHFNSFGKHTTTDPLMNDDIKVFLSSIENNIITPSSPVYQLNLTAEKYLK